MVQAALLLAVPLLTLALASLAALGLVRVGADWRLGLDPFSALRPRLPLSELAGRALMIDVVRQILMALLVVGVAIRRDPAGWRSRLGLGRPAAPRAPTGRLWWWLPIWPILHITWVSATAAALHVNFGQGVRLSPFLGPLPIGLWFVYIGLLAPLAEELLLRGETYARASGLLGPVGAITVTALLFCLAHVPFETGGAAALARPITLLPLALVLGWLRWRTGRLWPCILLHGWSNLAVVAYQLGPALR